MKNSAIIIQARMSSFRFPAKVMKLLAGMPLVEYVYKRCRQSGVKNVLVATSIEVSDDILYEHCRNNNIVVIRGDLNNVLARFLQAAEHLGAKYIARVCADTPFVDISLIKSLLKTLAFEDLDYIAMDRKTCIPGFYSEAVLLNALKKTSGLTEDAQDLENVTKFIIDNKDKFLTKFIDVDLSPSFVQDIRLTVDYPEDLELLNYLVAGLSDQLNFTSDDILRMVKNNKVKLCS